MPPALRVELHLRVATEVAVNRSLVGTVRAIGSNHSIMETEGSQVDTSSILDGE